VNKASNILERIATGIDGSRVINGILVFLPLNHVLRGLTFERSSVKGHYFVRRLVLPLYRRDGLFAMNYSKRIGTYSVRFDLASQPVEEAAIEVMEAIVESDSVNILRAINGPGDFLSMVRYVDIQTSKDPNLLTDIALSYFLNGNDVQCCRVLERIGSMPVEFPGTAPAIEAAASLLKALRSDSKQQIIMTIDEWEKRTKKAVFGEGSIDLVSD
jgi:hypothetical protein